MSDVKKKQQHKKVKKEREGKIIAGNPETFPPK